MTQQSSPKLNFVQFGDSLQGSDTVTKLMVRGVSRINHSKRDGRLYASQAGLCARQTALSANYEEDSVTSAAGAAYFSMGNTIEELVMDGLYESAALLFKQYKLPDVGLNLGGYVDGIIHVAGRLYVLEVKSCGQLPTVAKPYHTAQAHLYAAITGLPSIVFYFSRNVADFKGTLLTREFHLPLGTEDQRNAVFQAVYGRYAEELQVVPDIPSYIRSAAGCGFCPFIPYCWEGGEATNEWPHVTPRQHQELVDRTNHKLDELLDPAVVAWRRRGVINFLSTSGNKHAKKLLVGTDWSTLV